MIRNYENKKMKIKLNKPLRGYPAGVKVRIDTDGQGTPLELYWRRRLKDSKTDNCIEVMKEE